jgi:hypothetical protein
MVLMLTLRIAVIRHWAPTEFAAPGELMGLAVLAVLAAQGANARTLLAGATGAAFVLAALLSPFDALVWVAVLHNLTPLGLLWRAAPPDSRTKIVAVATAGLLALPLLVATGLPRLLLQPWAPEVLFDPLAAGPLAKNLFAYVPPSLLGGPHARDLFTAAVVAQCGHYLCVILILPALLANGAPNAQGLVRWPGPPIFAALCAFAGFLGTLRFCAGFADARTIYSLLAGAHVWIEVPVLVIALSGTHHAADRGAHWATGRARRLGRPAGLHGG